MDDVKIEEEPKSSNNAKRSPLEVGFVTFDLDHRLDSRHFGVPALVRPHVIPKIIPVVSKSRTTSTTSTVTNVKGPKGDHLIVPLGKNHVIIPIDVSKLHQIDPKVIVDHKELVVDHAADVVLDQKHVILEHSPRGGSVLAHPGQHQIILDHKNSHTVIFEHKPVLVDHGEHETNVLIHSEPKTLVLEHKPIVVTHPGHKDIVVHPQTVVYGSSRTILLSPKSQIHEIIVHRHVPKAVVVHPSDDDDDGNMFRSHYGGFGVGLNYGGQGAGHGFHVPVI